MIGTMEANWGDCVAQKLNQGFLVCRGYVWPICGVSILSFRGAILSIKELWTHHWTSVDKEGTASSSLPRRPGFGFRSIGAFKDYS